MCKIVFSGKKSNQSGKAFYLPIMIAAQFKITKYGLACAIPRRVYKD